MRSRLQAAGSALCSMLYALCLHTRKLLVALVSMRRDLCLMPYAIGIRLLGAWAVRAAGWLR